MEMAAAEDSFFRALGFRRPQWPCVFPERFLELYRYLLTTSGKKTFPQVHETVLYSNLDSPLHAASYLPDQWEAQRSIMRRGTINSTFPKDFTR